MELNQSRDLCSMMKGMAFFPDIPDSSLSSCIQGQFNQLVIQKKYKHEFVMDPPAGPPHNPVFRCTLKVEGSSYKGSGTTKKLAKSDAITKYFEGRARGPEECFSTSVISSPPPPPRGLTELAPILTENYVGSLHELCAKSALPQPSYKFNLNTSSNKYLFECFVQDLVTDGSHIAKKEAKKIASKNMMSLIGKRKKDGAYSPPSKPDSPPKEISPGDSPQRIARLPKTVTMMELAYPPPIVPIMMEDEESPNMDFNKLLLDISQKKGFQVAFDVTESGFSEYICIVQLGVFPVIVAIGNGATNSESKNDASKNALIYIKTLFK